MTEDPHNEGNYHLYIYGFLAIAFILNLLLHLVYPILPKMSATSYQSLNELSGATFFIFYFFILVFVIVVGGMVYFVTVLLIRYLKLKKTIIHIALFAVGGFFSGFILPEFPTTEMIFSGIHINVMIKLYIVCGFLMGAGLAGVYMVVKKKST
ncbi:hypothetical protein [Bacillus sp. RO1]|uniref:hypothetical protein n=1 Tax=Bacillus sp. RO1 TaxID=2722703 RepID=UPI0014572E7D|nr:hypothetical protein [Bacillus sp. RO1]NLP52390.1 hypothetical protein [Bacillus sp. RO1]